MRRFFPPFNKLILRDYKYSILLKRKEVDEKENFYIIKF